MYLKYLNKKYTVCKQHFTVVTGPIWIKSLEGVCLFSRIAIFFIPVDIQNIQIH